MRQSWAAFAWAAFRGVDLSRNSAFFSLGAASLGIIENVQTTNAVDLIIDDAKANRIQSLGSDDLIDGGEGDNVLIGRSGANTFVFEAVGIRPFAFPATTQATT